ncbi:hypothetical protein LX32DRAFT_96779 [Colletotrichum zoysiae]|uniref:PD-(D/E)XK nuclease-like domain-containing protein n=1 Tax=Colletotrichum zoysiae TaxID=1216348 RepID=A0AAD9M0C8_9PEZI|nr:hypothetical protein LX32DRAFT_96779 [Colletotrichum zoysiae]
MNLFDVSRVHCDSSATCDIENWIAQIGSPDSGCFMMPRTPSPTKRQKGLDLEATPTNLMSLSQLDSASISTSDVTSDSGASRRSANPKKRERELRQASDYPLRRDLISNYPKPTPLMKDLYALQDAAVIPSTVKTALTKDSTWANQPRQAWFYEVGPKETTQQTSTDADMYSYTRLRQIRENTILCKTRMEHEAGWNDSVHAPLLEVALSGESGISYRNVTCCRVLPDFLQDNQSLFNVKIDYAILLDFPPKSSLASAVRTFRRPDPRTRHATPLQLPDNPDTPTVIPIETKSATADMISGPVQLAAWAQLHFAYLQRLPSAGGELPVLPVIFVHGARWRIDFAQRTTDELVSPASVLFC